MQQPLSPEAGLVAAKPLVPGLRAMLYLASWLVFVVGVQLFVLTDHIHRLFAWDATPPLTATFLGAAYWASCVLEFLAARERHWAGARVAVPGVLLFTTITLALTLLNLDHLHLGSSFAPITVGLTWSWIGVYATVPPILAVLLVRQLVRPGGDPPRRAPMAGWPRAVIGAQAAVFLAAGVALMATPAAAWWPWPLTAFTGRAIAAWFIALALIGGQVVWEADYERARAVMASAIAFGALELIALARDAAGAAWGKPTTWGYALFLVSVLLAGAYGWQAGRNASAGATELALRPPRPRGGRSPRSPAAG